jgi:hypothetical protein
VKGATTIRRKLLHWLDSQKQIGFRDSPVGVATQRACGFLWMIANNKPPIPKCIKEMLQTELEVIERYRRDQGQSHRASL